jgi:hypothetical protein
MMSLPAIRAPILAASVRSPRSFLSAASGSAERINDSPTSTPSTPASSRSFSCSAPAIPDSETTVTPPGISPDQATNSVAGSQTRFHKS